MRRGVKVNKVAEAGSFLGNYRFLSRAPSRHCDVSSQDLTLFRRRRFLRQLSAVPLAYLLSMRGSSAGSKSGELQPTPPCLESDEPTPKQIEGPYFKTESPERLSLIDTDISGTRLVLEGRVLSTDCKPIAAALLDFWQADDMGRYDLAGYRLRGHQFSDDRGRFRLETIVPGRYPYRTPHIHVKVQAPHERVLTTQLYFPGELQNERDFLFDPRLLMVVAETDFGMSGHFDFVLSIG